MVKKGEKWFQVWTDVFAKLGNAKGTVLGEMATKLNEQCNLYNPNR